MIEEDQLENTKEQRDHQFHQDEEGIRKKQVETIPQKTQVIPLIFIFIYFFIRVYSMLAVKL